MCTVLIISLLPYKSRIQIGHCAITVIAVSRSRPLVVSVLSVIGFTRIGTWKSPHAVVTFVLAGVGQAVGLGSMRQRSGQDKQECH